MRDNYILKHPCENKPGKRREDLIRKKSCYGQYHVTPSVTLFIHLKIDHEGNFKAHSVKPEERRPRNFAEQR